MTLAQMFGATPKAARYSLPRFEKTHHVNFAGVFALTAVECKEPPGAILRYDGRLATPSACGPIIRYEH